MAHKVGREEVDEGAGYHTGWMRLMADVMCEAYRDFYYEDLELQLDALYFLAGPYSQVFTSALDIQGDPLAPLTRGKKPPKRRRVA